MVPHDERHARMTRWMSREDPVFRTRTETLPPDAEVVEVNGLCMIYAHEADRSCCEINFRNQEEPMYRRDADGRLIRGR